MARKRKQLHQPPPEFAKAKEARGSLNLIEQRYRWEISHNRPLPSHPKGRHPYLKRNVLWYETYEQAKFRLANRKAGKIFI